MQICGNCGNGGVARKSRLHFSIISLAFFTLCEGGSHGAITLENYFLPLAKQISRADGQKAVRKNGRCQRPAALKRNVSSDHELEESEGGTCGISQGSPRSPGGLFKIQQRKRRHIAMLAPRRARSAAAIIESCCATPPRLSTEFEGQVRRATEAAKNLLARTTYTVKATKKMSVKAKGGYDDYEEEVRGGDSEDQAGGEDIEHASLIL